MLPKCFILGNLAADPVIGISNSGIKYARISIASNEQYSKTRPQPKTHYFQCIAWNKRAEYIGNNLKKGDGVWSEVTLSNNTYTNTQGKVSYNNDLIIENIIITNHRSKVKKQQPSEYDVPTINNSISENNESDFIIEPIPTPSSSDSTPTPTFDEIFNTNISDNNE